MKNTTLILASLLFSILSISGTASSQQNVIWYDGRLRPIPSGALLTNNPGYWEEMIHTDVTYSYLEEPTNPHDWDSGKKDTFGNRLLDGQRSGDWHTTVGMNRKPLVVDFDFHQEITLQNVAVAQRDSNLQMAQIEVRNQPNDAWKKVLLQDDPHKLEGSLHLLQLPESAAARYVRLTLKGVGTATYINQIWMWGDAKPVEIKPLNGFFPNIKGDSNTKDAQPGDATILSENAFRNWRKKTGYTGTGVIAQIAPTWQMLNKNPLKSTFLPDREISQQPIHMKMTRSEGESAAVFLVNAGNHAENINVRLSDFKDSSGKTVAALRGNLYVAGAIWTRRWGHTLRPLFDAENKLGAAQMTKYLTNGNVIKDFPTLHLPPRGTAMLWITIISTNTPRGSYSTNLHYGNNSLPIQLNVNSINLPSPDVWVRYWGNAPASNANLWHAPKDMKRELEYQQSMGVSVYRGWPEKRSWIDEARQLSKKSRHHKLYVIDMKSDNRNAALQGELNSGEIDEKLKKQIREEIQEKVKIAQDLGLLYKDWSLELWDEPNEKNMAGYAAIAEFVKNVDPKVQIFMNPLFWKGGRGFADDATQVKYLEGWYNKLIDVSVPIEGQVNTERFPQANEQFYNHRPRAVRAYYIHPNTGRMLSWEALKRDYNGWGFYAYFAPRGDAWTDYDKERFDYNIIYPGPAGYVPTIESESMRESWEDYRLATLLKQQGKTEKLQEILQIYDSGVIGLPDAADEMPDDRDDRSTKAVRSLPALRERMMNIAMK